MLSLSYLTKSGNLLIIFHGINNVQETCQLIRMISVPIKPVILQDYTTGDETADICL
jgi:hypothetical protein